MGESPKVSVIVASYNYEDFVVETLTSLWNQTFRDFEIVIVDDGSSDGSVRNIRRFMDGHANEDVAIRLLTHADGANRGLPATIELGVRESAGEFVAFCESDDLWTPDHLERIFEDIRKADVRLDIVVNDVELFGDADRCAFFLSTLYARRAMLRPGLNRISPAVFRDSNYIVTFSCAMARRSVLSSCDFHPVARSSALDWWLWRQLCYNRSVWYVDQKLTRWRMHASLMVSDHDDPSYSERQRAFLAAGSALLRRQHPISSHWRLFRSVPQEPQRWSKRLRGVVKRLLPYGLQRIYAERVYGIVFPDCETWPGGLGKMQRMAVACLPFGLVCLVNGFDPDKGIDDKVLQGSRQTTCRMPRSRLDRISHERAAGLQLSAESRKRNHGVRIAVLLHLYYDSAWQAIACYLDNLKCYSFDLVVTVVEGCISDRTLEDIQSYAPTVRIVRCENRGYDIWPFIKVLAETDLSRYDVVFKIHSKGTRRPFLFMYGQVFKRDDWFYNLFDGILGGLSVHKAIDAIVNGGAKLVAAENLIVRDPKHKYSMVRDFCASRGLNFVEDYRFVAGSCFAVHPEALVPLKKLELSASDFEPACRGEFSTAHAIERWMCFAAAGAMRGMPVERNDYARAVKKCRKTSSLRLLDDSRFELDPEFFYRVLEPRAVNRYEVAKIRLGDIRRKTFDNRIISLQDCEPYLYLHGEKGKYGEYCLVNRQTSGFKMSAARFDALRASMLDYDPRRMPVLKGAGNFIMDGQHRCCILLDRFGPDYEIEVLKIW